MILLYFIEYYFIFANFYVQPKLKVFTCRCYGTLVCVQRYVFSCKIRYVDRNKLEISHL